jgi:hypothetical protein
MILVGNNRNALRQTCPTATFSPQIPYRLAWDITRAFKAMSRRLIASAMTREEETAGSRRELPTEDHLYISKYYVNIV